MRVPTPETLHRAIADAARAMQREEGREQTMQVAADAVRHLVAGCDVAAVSVRARHSFESLITSSDPDGALGVAEDPQADVQAIDTLQHELQEGPCHEAMRDVVPVHSADLCDDPRWERWTPEAVRRLHVRSVVSHPLTVGDRAIGALKLYGAEPGAFSADDLDLVGIFAVHVGVALAAARQVEHLTDALDSRTLIGQATGVLMARYDLSADAAFAAMARTSQQTNTRVRALAEHIVATGRLPEQ